MEIPNWLNPGNWTPETKAAAHEMAKVAVIFVVTLISANMGSNQIRDVVVRKVPSR